ncbi:hypothetical protein WR25_13497 [Diploscapter pachys]|uniref:Uncharacterized protein n=1 Tax=Diploscapter pachys TaxID=2018661 RepID=A0A2A2JW09_9BILA|nr:hypothetical protein WR25_13497 [Diploscapter pachys]
MKAYNKHMHIFEWTAKDFLRMIAIRNFNMMWNLFKRFLKGMEENEMRMLEAAGGNREKKSIEYVAGTVFARLDKIRKEQGDEIPRPKTVTNREVEEKKSRENVIKLQRLEEEWKIQRQADLEDYRKALATTKQHRKLPSENNLATFIHSQRIIRSMELGFADPEDDVTLLELICTAAETELTQDRLYSIDLISNCLIYSRYMEKVLQLKCCPAAEKSDKWTRKIYDLLCAILNLWKIIYARYKEIWSKEACCLWRYTIDIVVRIGRRSWDRFNVYEHKQIMKFADEVNGWLSTDPTRDAREEHLEAVRESEKIAKMRRMKAHDLFGAEDEPVAEELDMLVPKARKEKRPPIVVNRNIREQSLQKFYMPLRVEMTSNADNERITREIAEGMNRQRQAQERIRKAGRNREDEWDSDEETTIQGENDWNAQAENWEEEDEGTLKDENSQADADAAEERQVKDQVEVRADNFEMEAAETIHKDSGSDAEDSFIKMSLNLDAMIKQEEKKQSVDPDVFAVIHQEQPAILSPSSAFSTHLDTFCLPSTSTQDDNHSISSILSTADVPKRGILKAAVPKKSRFA